MRYTRHMSANETVFSKILSGELPCHRVYEDEHVLAFLDINPISAGHTLLIPKQKVACFHELDQTHAQAMGRALPRLCKAVLDATGADGYNLLQNNGAPAGQCVFHVHIHIIPHYPDQPSAPGLSLNWRPQSLDAAKASVLLEAIREKIE